jgi:hypothetical protein
VPVVMAGGACGVLCLDTCNLGGVKIEKVHFVALPDIDG